MHENVDPNCDLNLSVALYLACYFHQDNLSCKSYLAKYQPSTDENLSKFLKLWEQYEKSKIDQVKTSQRERLKDFEQYYQYCKVIESLEVKKFQRFLEMKKFFCIPWLIANDKIFQKGDFLKEVLNYKKNTLN